ncbi:MAG: DedA family protein [Pirellulales bacterium]|nr:DedA family protein [Pirellulales bacterium]
MKKLLDFFLKLDDHLARVVADYGTWTYAILFAIIFCETGLVVTPILPGDSLLFAAGAFAAKGALDLTTLLVLLSIAAVGGDAVNYSIGKYLGPKVLTGNSRFLKKEYLDKTHAFFERYGQMTIIMARFVPIVRTFAPFMAGVGTMSYLRFASYNVVGGILWVLSMTLAGYFFGAIPWVHEHFEAVVLGIVFVSLLPAVIEAIRLRWQSRKAEPANEAAR